MYPIDTEATNLKNTSYTGYNQTALTKFLSSNNNAVIKGIQQVFAWLSQDVRAKAKMSSTQEISNAAYTPFTALTNLSVVAGDTTSGLTVKSGYDLGSGRLASGIEVDTGYSGLFLALYMVEYPSNATGARTAAIRVYRPGTGVLSDQYGKFEVGAAGASNYTSSSPSTVLFLNDLDFVFIETAQSSGGNLAVQTSSYLQLARLR